MSRLYSTTSEIITVILIIWCLNFFAGLIQRTYATGQAFGSFYRKYLHGFIKSTLAQILNIFAKRRFANDEDSGMLAANSKRA